MEKYEMSNATNVYVNVDGKWQAVEHFYSTQKLSIVINVILVNAYRK
jgi:hypothetical protein